MAPPTFPVILTAHQERDLLAAVALRAACIVVQERCDKIAELLPEIAGVKVIGAFVSFKCNGALRSCMGCLAESMTLGDAVEAATWRAVRDDPRFPPISSGELSELTLEVWLLWGMREVTVRGKHRLHEITIGRHGLQIIRGGNRGLLLPGVALEHNMDAATFLEAVCQKAGLPRDAWYADDTQLFTFEGRAVRGEFEKIDFPQAMLRDLQIASRIQHISRRAQVAFASLPSRAETEQLRNVCAQSLQLMKSGRTGAALYPELWNGNVSGAAIALALVDRPLMICSQIAVRPEKKLQATLHELVRVMYEQVMRVGVTLQEFEDAVLDLAIFSDPAIHGTTQQHDVSGVETATRSVMISGALGWIVLYHPAENAATLVQNGKEYVLADSSPAAADVISLATSSTWSPLLVTSFSRPNVGDEYRAPAVAGTFYPATKIEIESALHKIEKAANEWNMPTISSHQKRATQNHISAIMVPHAGWIYSGTLAQAVFSRVTIPARVIIFAPKHTPHGADFGIAPHRVWKFPHLEILSDVDLAIRLDRNVDLFHLDAAPHTQEHAIEVLLPILAQHRRDVRAVGVTLAAATWSMIHDAASQLAHCLVDENKTEAKENEMPLLIISTDLNHFATQEQTQRVDQIVLDALQTLDPHAVLRAVHENAISMCGATACALVMETLRQMNRLHSIEIVGHTTSAKISGDTTRVVGYAGAIFS